MGKRDYSLTGPDTAAAVASGLAAADWYHTDVPRAEMKALMQRTDGPAIRDTVIWLGLMLVFAAGGIWFYGSWWCVPFCLAYGVLYGSATDSRWHECGHGTAFKTGWMNRTVYQIACFMIMRNPTVWRWSHARHHADTIIVGRDPEISVMRPPDLLKLVLGFVGSVGALVANDQAAQKTDPRLIYRQAILTRVTHWTWAIAMFFLLLSGLNIWNAHPALYIGQESGFAYENAILRIAAENTEDGPRGFTTVFGQKFDTTGVLGMTPRVVLQVIVVIIQQRHGSA